MGEHEVMNKNSIKENLWKIGALIIILGGSLLGLFMLSNEEFYLVNFLHLYTVGFLIIGFILLFFGFILTIICLDRYEESEIKQDNTTKIRVVLTAVTILYLILIGYLMSIDHEWIVQPLIINLFDQSFAFYYGFSISSNAVFFVSLFLFGIFVFPFVIAETGFLNDSLDEPAYKLEEEGYTVEEAKDNFDRFVAFLKRQFAPIMKMKKIKNYTIQTKNYTLPISIAFTILGSFLVILPYFILIDGPPIWDPETETFFVKAYKGFIRGQLLFISLLLLIVGLTLIIHYKRRRSHSTV
jgi:hypothetical protein